MINLELTQDEANHLMAIIISGRFGLRGAAKKKHKLGFHNAAMRSAKIADTGDIISSKLIKLGTEIKIPLYEMDKHGVDHLIKE